MPPSLLLPVHGHSLHEQATIYLFIFWLIAGSLIRSENTTEQQRKQQDWELRRGGRDGGFLSDRKLLNSAFFMEALCLSLVLSI